MARNGGGARWNEDTQSWERTEAAPPPHPVAPPPMPTAPPPVPPTAPHPDLTTGPAPAGPSGAGASGRRSRLTQPVMIGATAVAILVAGCGVGWLLWGQGDDGRVRATPTASVSASAGDTDRTADPDTADPGASDASEAAGTDGAVPDGYERVQDDYGFTTVVPEGWERTTARSSAFYTAPDGRSLIQIFEITEDYYTPYEALQKASDNLAREDGYEELSLQEQVEEDDSGLGGAELVYAYDSERLDGDRAQVIDRAFTAPNGRKYAVLSSGPATDWPTQRTRESIALRFFEPAP
ncbi:hypothetical protein AB0I82_29540 [Streptomyces sp. NPDC050315]|uniref:hypothetical protein n=1 Tax=Streptomyces sp. NPDC050315 TaxID=3155039 RepID=UPI00342E77F0